MALHCHTMPWQEVWGHSHGYFFPVSLRFSCTLPVSLAWFLPGVCCSSQWCPSPCSCRSLPCTVGLLPVVLSHEPGGKQSFCSASCPHPIGKAGGDEGFSRLLHPQARTLQVLNRDLLLHPLRLSKTADADVPSPLITSSLLVAASYKARLGTSICCRWLNAASEWLDPCKFLKIHGHSVLGDVLCFGATQALGRSGPFLASVRTSLINQPSISGVIPG